MLIAPFALAAALPLSFEDLADLDTRIATIGSAAPVDRRLKLPRCPLPADIAPMGGNAIAVRCPSLGWRILVPLVAAPQSMSAPDIRKGDIVELYVDGAGFSVSTSATAVEDGRVGNAVRVRPSDGNAPVSVTVLGAGRVRANSIN
jgi:flagella basal body P-ring formation protein FlgA